jgi:hypothetical protein
MSNGRKQKKPLSKKTRSLLDQLKRRRGIRNLPERFLIVCEDNKSAVNYFNALVEHFGISATSVQVAGSNGNTQPIQVAEKAIELKRIAARRDSGTVPFDHVWCVIDGDYGSKIHNARAKAKKNGVKLAISTMCFEYWVLLHFEETGKPTIDCDCLVSILRRTHIKKYEKGKCDFKDIVKRVHNACKRAERLRKPGIDRGELPENQNPCSEVNKLIHEILKHADQETEPGSQPSAPQEPAGAAGSHRGASPDLTGRKGARKRNGRGANASE